MIAFTAIAKYKITRSRTIRAIINPLKKVKWTVVSCCNKNRPRKQHDTKTCPKLDKLLFPRLGKWMFRPPDFHLRLVVRAIYCTTDGKTSRLASKKRNNSQRRIWIFQTQNNNSSINKLCHWWQKRNVRLSVKNSLHLSIAWLWLRLWRVRVNPEKLAPAEKGHLLQISRQQRSHEMKIQAPKQSFRS